MPEYIIEIKPKKSEFDPLGRQVGQALINEGQETAASVVHTERLYKIEGDLSIEQIQSIIQNLLVDPVVEIGALIEKSKKGAEKSGFVVDVWPKHGVTDPVGETVVKGLMDLGFQGEYKATSATRYNFPKLKDQKFVEKFCVSQLGNELINDINIRRN